MSALICTFHSFAKNRRLQGLLVASVIVTFLLITAIVGAAVWALQNTAIFQSSWLEWLADLVGGFTALIVGLILVPALMPLIAGLLEEPILKALEAETLEKEIPQGKQSFVSNLIEDLRFMAVVIVLNLFALPLYLIPVLNFVVYYVLNGYLLGREFFTAVDGYYDGKKDARKTFNAHKTKLFAHGVLLAFVAIIPLVGLFLPVFALTLMFHMRQKL